MTARVEIPDSWIRRIRRAALSSMFYDGHPTPSNRLVVERCTWPFADVGLAVIFTRDQGMHTSGWWKNPDFERCWHLSVSMFVPYAPAIPRPFSFAETEPWVTGLFGRDNAKLTWWEGPWSPEGKVRGVHHVRLFCDEGWQPIKPRGEVYRRAMPSDWRSWSEVQAERELTGQTLSTPIIGGDDA